MSAEMGRPVAYERGHDDTRREAAPTGSQPWFITALPCGTEDVESNAADAKITVDKTSLED